MEEGGGEGRRGRKVGREEEGERIINPTSESYSFCYVKRMLWVQVTVQ